MKLKSLAVLVAVLVSLFAASVYADHAVCPGQQTTVFFVNGVYAEAYVEKYKNRLQALVEEQGADPDCVHFTALPNHDEIFNLDLLEAVIQKTREFGINFAHGYGMLLRLVIPDAWFLDHVIDVAYSRNTIGHVNDANLVEHMLAYRAALALGHHIILTCHSQGCLYTEQAYFRMSEEERAKARFVTVVTPATGVPGDGPNTRLFEDSLAGLFFAAAVLPNIANAEACAGDIIDRWSCHGMETSYLHGTNSRTKIVNDIITALEPPEETATLQGTIYVELFNTDVFPPEPYIETAGGATVRLIDDQALRVISTTTSDVNGFYSMVVSPCPSCLVHAQKNIQGEQFFFDVDGFQTSLPIVAGETYTIDVMMYGVPVVQ